MDTDNSMVKVWEGQVLGGGLLEKKENICNTFNTKDKLKKRKINCILNSLNGDLHKLREETLTIITLLTSFLF